MNAPYDGNILAGPLAEAFDMEVTSAIARCAGCRRSTVVAELAVYGPDPGLVARCRGCGHGVLRLVRTPTLRVARPQRDEYPSAPQGADDQRL